MEMLTIGMLSLMIYTYFACDVDSNFFNGGEIFGEDVEMFSIMLNRPPSQNKFPQMRLNIRV